MPIESSLPSYEQIAKMIDHSLLHPTMSDADLERGCLLARTYDVASVCIKPYAVRMSVELLSGSSVQPGTTIGFPHGGHPTFIKVAEARQALRDGATELDVVVNIGKALSGDWDYVREDLSAVLLEAHGAGAIVKVIFENCYLERDHKVRLCELCSEIGADFVKTSTGYGTGGATHEDLRLMRDHCPDRVQIKAAGGVRTLDALLEVRALGVSRCGATATATILDELRLRLGLEPVSMGGADNPTLGY